MKKLITLLFAIVMCISLVACGEKSTSKQTSNEIQLTVDNIYTYLNITGKYEDSYYERGVLYYSSYSTVALETYGVQSGTFENVVLEVKAQLPDGHSVLESWEVKTDDSAYNATDPTILSFSIRLPSDGRFNDTHNIICEQNSDKLEGSCDFEIVSVSGKFVPAR